MKLLIDHFSKCTTLSFPSCSQKESISGLDLKRAIISRLQNSEAKISSLIRICVSAENDESFLRKRDIIPVLHCFEIIISNFHIRIHKSTPKRVEY